MVIKFGLRSVKQRKFLQHIFKIRVSYIFLLKFPKRNVQRVEVFLYKVKNIILMYIRYTLKCVVFVYLHHFLKFNFKRYLFRNFNMKMEYKFRTYRRSTLFIIKFKNVIQDHTILSLMTWDKFTYIKLKCVCLL